MYTRQAKDGSLLILILYVDDMLIASRQMAKISALKSKMAKVFDMKDMGESSNILGMRIHQDRSKKRLYLSQEEYIDKVLQHFNMDRGKALMTPLPSKVKLSNQDCPLFDEEKTKMDKVPYASACGSLMYAMIGTRPDIAFAVRVHRDSLPTFPRKARSLCMSNMMLLRNGMRTTPDDGGGRSRDWELRPCGMVVQVRDSSPDTIQAGPLIKVKVSYGRSIHEVSIAAFSTFGEDLSF
ncbi:hypothetical protein L7F22_064533 [Adiantum nelumboides]|nr:hypothetical protein [Adiantum nelumboides]